MHDWKSCGRVKLPRGFESHPLRLVPPSRVSQRRRPPWLLGIFLLIGVALVVGAFSVYRDQHSGTAGMARVTECDGGSKYVPAIRCTGTWEVGGGGLLGDGEVVVGRVEGAGYGDVGKTIDVRVHGTDHTTKPSLGTPIILSALGGTIVALALWGLVAWWRRD